MAKVRFGGDVLGLTMLLLHVMGKLGDVAIAIESGQSPTKNVMFRYNKIGNSHGLAIGSWQNGGIQDITFKNIVIQGSDALDTGPNLIAARGRGNLTQNVLFQNIQMYNMGYCITLSMNFTQPIPLCPPIRLNIRISTLTTYLAQMLTMTILLTPSSQCRTPLS
uniref:Polygalacturonase n=1 Tax=Acrobeloides nanus TaxID=290746 RepID=A0A914CRF3_9BILA